MASLQLRLLVDDVHGGDWELDRSYQYNHDEHPIKKFAYTVLCKWAWFNTAATMLQRIALHEMNSRKLQCIVEYLDRPCDSAWSK